MAVCGGNAGGGAVSVSGVVALMFFSLKCNRSYVNVYDNSGKKTGGGAAACR